MKILTIIPAKTDSKRLPQKNLQKIGGKTLLEHSIDYAKMSIHDNSIIVSSESGFVKHIAKENGVKFMERSPELCGETEVVDVYLDVLKNLGKVWLGGEHIEFDLVVALQPDHPDREHTFDECVAYMVDNNYDDLITIEKNYKRSGSVRIFKYKLLKEGFVSKRIGTICDSATDIHYEEDLEKAKKNME